MFWEGSRWSPNAIPDLHGRVAIVTGANSGLGYVTALELARHGARTYLACRNPGRAAKAIEMIKTVAPASETRFLELDLTSLSSAHSAAQEFLSRETRLDILVNNAGISGVPYKLSEDGIELHACNGTGHFAFTVPLLGLLERTSQEPGAHVRIVNVSSSLHWLAWRPDFTSMAGLNQASWGPFGRYSKSKLSIILFTNELQKKLQHTKIICVSVHPGVAYTEISKSAMRDSYPFLNHWIITKLQELFMLTPEEGAITQLYAATSPEVDAKDLRAAYLRPFGAIGWLSSAAKDVDGQLGAQFWNLCEALVKQKVTRAQSNIRKDSHA